MTDLRINHNAIAGTLESSDIQVMIEPTDNGLHIDLQSSVIAQYGEQIKQTVTEVLQNLEVENARVVCIDKGALECTIRSRVQTAVLRASDTKDNIPWGTKL